MVDFDMTTDQRIYNEIGQAFMDRIPEEFAEARLTLKYATNENYSKARYRKQEKDEWISFAARLPFMELMDWLEELHSYTHANGFKKWNTLQFVLFPDGKFSIEFEWDQEWEQSYEDDASDN